MMPGLLALLPLLLTQDAAIDVAKDPALQKKVTVTAKSELINDALADIGKAAGVQLAAVQNIRDLKVNVFAKNEPAGPLMDRIADVLGAEWTKDGEVYRLGIERLAQQQRTAYEQAEQRLMRERIDTELLAYTRYAAVNPNAPKADLSKLDAEERAKVDRFASDPTAHIFGQMLTAMSGAAGAGFWRGEVRTYVPTPPRVQANIQVATQPDESKRVFARFDPFLVSLEKSPARNSSLITNSLVHFEQPPAKLADLPFAKSVLSWSATGENFEEDDRFTKSVLPVPLPSGEHFAPKPTLSDHVEAFHRGTGIAIVSDGFSLPKMRRPTASDASSWVKGLRSLGAQGNVRHGIVGVRHQGFWRLRQFELAPSALRSYAQFAEIEPLTLDQYASFAGTLKGPPASALLLDDAVALPFDGTPLVKMMPALTFYNSLTPAQKRQAHSGLEATMLNDAQRRLFMDALLWGALKGFGKPANLQKMVQGDFTETGVVVSEEAFGSGVKNKQGNEIVGGRKFFIYLGSRNDAVRFDSEVKGREPKKADK